MLRSLVSVALVLALAGCYAQTARETPVSSEEISIEPGADAPSLDALVAIPGGTVRFDDAARVVYRGEGSATVHVRLDAGRAWSLLSPDIVTLRSGESAPVAIQIRLTEEEADAGSAELSAALLARSSPLPKP